MRRRLLLVLLTFSAIAVTAFAWPLLMTTAAERTQRFVISRTGDLDRFTAIAQTALLDKDATELAYEAHSHHELYGDDVIVVDAYRDVQVQAGLTLADAGVSDAVDGALKNQPVVALGPLRPWSRDEVLFAAPIGTDTRVMGAVVLRSTAGNAAADIAGQWALILSTALAAAMACVALVQLLARWVLRPLAELERGVHAVTEGRRTEDIGERSGPPELRVLAGLFNRMSRAVAESAEQQRRLVADASHELRSPIARLRLPVDSLAGHIPPEGREAYDRIVAELGELESLSKSLLGMANADRNALELVAGTGDDESCDATELLVERREAWLPTAELAGVTLDVAESAPPVRLVCPETELKQVLDATLDNAIKYAGADTRVRMDCTEEPGRGRLAITDDGPGLSDQERDYATTRFWRSRRHGAETGSGLGLAIAERLVTARGGTLRIRANNPRGLVVEVTLPLAREEQT